MPIMAQDAVTSCFDPDFATKRRITLISTSSRTEECNLKIIGCNGFDVLYDDESCDYLETIVLEENGATTQTGGKNIVSARCNW